MSTAPIYKPLEIEVTDFGPIAKAKIDLRPLTVFVGPSNTGKSYLAMLIYALHNTFGRHGYSSLGLTGLSKRFSADRFGRALWERDELSESEVDAVLDWGTDLAPCVAGKKITADFPLHIPDAVAEIIRPVLSHADYLFSQLDSDIARCFGRESTAKLKRIGSSCAWQVSLARRMSGANGTGGPLTYEFTINGDLQRSVATLPDSAPLIIEEGDAHRWNWENLRELAWSGSIPREDDSYLRSKQAEGVLYDLTQVVGISILDPLDRLAHYLPADRAGVMQTHRVVVASLIQRSSRAALQREEPLPALSGVLADFLEQLVGLGEPPRSRQKESWDLPRILEKDILNGRVREEQSATGYPIFSYQPAGSKQDIPLMQASSMVSELAPVVLYLRHLVQPGDVLIIEEPESHLHPGMQAAFTRQLAAAVRAGVRVMLTTHSDYVLEELGNLVRMSELREEQRSGIEGANVALTPDEVGVWLFEQKTRPKGSVVKEVPLDTETGIFPAGFGDVTEALYNNSVEIDSRIGESNPSNESR